MKVETKIQKKVDERMERVTNFLVTKYGKINDEWSIILDMLADTLKTKYMVDAVLDEEGIITEDRFGHKSKNPLIKTSLEISVQLQKIIQQLGISPLSLGKLKENDGDDTAAILNNLLGE